MKDRRDLIEVLKRELEFLESGGYQLFLREPWRAQLVFEDSPSCPNSMLEQKEVPCEECVLMELVPKERREERIPCRHIPLNGAGETIEYFYRCATQEELEDAMGAWLRSTIERLERESKTSGGAGFATGPPEMRGEESVRRQEQGLHAGGCAWK